jgi:hypothetical protein
MEGERTVAKTLKQLPEGRRVWRAAWYKHLVTYSYVRQSKRDIPNWRELLRTLLILSFVKICW